MAVEYSTLLGYLGKEITFKFPCPAEYDKSGFMQISGRAISVLIELNGKHSLCVLYDDKLDSSDFFEYEQMIF